RAPIGALALATSYSLRPALSSPGPRVRFAKTRSRVRFAKTPLRRPLGFVPPNPSFVMAGRSRRKDGVAALAYDPAIQGKELQRKAFVVAPPHGCAGEARA